MHTQERMLIDLEKSFWQSMVDEDTETALSLLNEPGVMVGPRGAFRFDHAGYRKMARQGPTELRAFELSDMEVLFPTDATAVLTYRARQSTAPRGREELSTQQMAYSSTWVCREGRWQCVMHTETPMPSGPEPVALELARSRTLLRHEA